MSFNSEPPRAAEPVSPTSAGEVAALCESLRRTYGRPFSENLRGSITHHFDLTNHPLIRQAIAALATPTSANGADVWRLLRNAEVLFAPYCRDATAWNWLDDARAALAKPAAPAQPVAKGVSRDGCKYLATAGSMCRKCGHVHEEPTPAPAEAMADVWHEGSQSFYQARLIRKLTPAEAMFDPSEIPGAPVGVDAKKGDA